ncbi:acyltransferase [Streptomyces sp. NPDC001851]|uniref:acyltransferase family protein n=1 Tax=Streptomyces sp. NPDC001851 TaxID=3154529 RepID=UPI003322E5A2
MADLSARTGGRLHAAVLRIDAATPPDRDRAIDTLRALAVLGVVIGHWLVTGVVLRASGHLMGDSPLSHMPAFTPVSWMLQPLAVFFFIGGRVAAQGYATARFRGAGYREWLGRRMRRLLQPVAALLIVWTLVTIGLIAAGIAHETIHTLLKLVLSPLWFILVFAALTAATPLVYRAGRRLALSAGLLVAVLDLTYFASGESDWAGTLRSANVLAGWLVPYCLGAVWAAGGFARRRSSAALLAAGLIGAAGLILWGGYPASMVGVPGERMSNLDPPSLAALAFGCAQCGAALLLCGPLRRMTGGHPPAAGDAIREEGRREEGRATPAQFAWAAVAMLNLSAVTVFLWHQTAMLETTVVVLGFDRPFLGLHTSPDHPAWALARLGWIPLFFLMLVALCAVFRGLENASRTRRAPKASRTARPQAGPAPSGSVGPPPGARPALPLSGARLLDHHG